MSLHRYFARREGLPEANGDLSASVPSRAIALANSEVLKVMVPETEGKKKRGPYKRSVLGLFDYQVSIPIHL